MKKLLIVLIIAGVMAYLFNPQNGDRHRSQIRNKAESLRKTGSETSSEAA